MTHATKAIYKLLLSDYVKVSKVSVEDMLFDEQDILRSMDKIEVCFSVPFTSKDQNTLMIFTFSTSCR